MKDIIKERIESIEKDLKRKMTKTEKAFWRNGYFFGKDYEINEIKKEKEKNEKQ